MDPGRVLAAGGLVPVGAELGEGGAAGVVVARAYRHPALPGRTVVRLSVESVAAGDEREMEVLGFGPGEDRGAVGLGRRRALGFPGWALVHEPAQAQLALEVARELERHARGAASRPAQAKDEIEALGAWLGAQAPRLLPAFYEEAGRAFVAQGAPTYAAAMFGLARDAEVAHRLAVDERHRADAFLEFALAGAVTAKALAGYARDLAARHPPAVAYAYFRELCGQRALGGLAPTPAMARELRRLAKAAGAGLPRYERGQ